MAGLRPMGVSVRTHLSSQDSQFNLFIGFSFEDTSRTVGCVCVCSCVHHFVLAATVSMVRVCACVSEKKK